MATVEATGPCPHGVTDDVCWSCTRRNIGTALTILEWFNLQGRRVSRALDYGLLRRILGKKRYIRLLEWRLARGAR